jgi:sec-independent protein translocase protein TatB
MPNFTISEIATIALVILIVFGPQRLPEMARKTGNVIRKIRTMATDLRREFEGEFQEVTQPLKDVSNELKGVQQDIGGTLNSLSDEVVQAKEEVESQLGETNAQIDDVINPPAAPKRDTAASEPDTVADDQHGEEQ